MVIASPDDVADEMVEKLADVLDHKIMPKKIIAVDKLERTTNGKLKRQIIG
jgi:acyl-coenzyme A synthetase/AMP-(fatty) acid ligase